MSRNRAVAQCLIGVAFPSLLLLLAGCASEGPLKPPSLLLPGPVRHLSAERFGSAVNLRWTDPVRTTDGISLSSRKSGGPFTAEVCRGLPVAKGQPAPCILIARLPATGDASATYADKLPADLLATAPVLVQYRVRVVNARGKGAEYQAVEVAGTPAPASVQQLTAQPVSRGADLRWQKDGAPADTMVVRVERGPSKEKPDSSLLSLGKSSSDPGGTLDTGARAGVEQRYTLYRSRTVLYDGKTYIVNSVPAAVTILAGARQTPPSAPVGLDAVVNTLAMPEVDLIWQASEEPGVVGYLLSRAEGSGAWQVITAQPVAGFSYADKDVRPGGVYRYRVAAVNGQGTAGAYSAPSQIAVPTQ